MNIDTTLEIFKNGFFLASVFSLRLTVIHILEGLSETNNPTKTLTRLGIIAKIRFTYIGIISCISAHPLCKHFFKKDYSVEYTNYEISLMNNMHQLRVFEPTVQEKYISFGKAISWGFMAVTSAGFSFVAGILKYFTQLSHLPKAA